ncbi:MAG: hypothetical protein M1114_01115 [Candidatus Dependentiae bacterium]|nr:hypothetical protein [Candidatus Dependentiae bacterium]
MKIKAITGSMLCLLGVNVVIGLDTCQKKLLVGHNESLDLSREKLAGNLKREFHFGQSHNYSDKAVKPERYSGSLEQVFPLEIEAKNGDLVYVDITNGTCKLVQGYELSSKKQGLSKKILRLTNDAFDINKPTIITIKTSGSKKGQTYTISGNGKTVYLKWEDNRLQPRIGSMLGKKTPSGLSIKNNIADKDIKTR